GDEEGDARGMRGLLVEMHGAEAGDFERALAGARRGCRRSRSCRERCGARRCEGDGSEHCETAESLHRATTPFKPPAMSAERWARMRGSAGPPGEARQRGPHTGTHF